MKGGPAKGAIRAWLERLEAATPVTTPVTKPLRSGIFDNRKTNQREKWENGKLGPARPADWCPPSHPFGTYPDVEEL